jgi:predicted RNA-binding protein associated with RNAse of E/G family
MTSSIRIQTLKWPDREHWSFEVRRLGEDEFGTWVHAPSSTEVRRGSEEPFALGAGFVGLIPMDEWWIVEFYPDHPEITVYVNIGTPPEWDGSRLTQVDLDLDVVRRLDGTVEIIDEDEFEEHRITLGYPDELIVRAREAADKVERLMKDGVEPFGRAAEEWLSRVDPASMRRQV